MAKNLLQDMVRSKVSSRSTRDVKPFSRVDRETVSSNLKPTKKNSKYRIYFVALISIIFLLFALSFLFSGAKVILIPKIEEISINNNLTATKDSNTKDLSFDLVVISGEEKKIIQATEEKDVVTKAEGAIILYNAFNTSPAVFSIGTKLEGSNGKIYKTIKKITIPGMTKSGKPGIAEVDIIALEAGEEYNSKLIDFKIVSLKGTSKYTKIYGRSKTEITGGFKGKFPFVSSLDEVTAINELKATMESKLLKKVTDQIPSGFILFKDAVFLDINDKNISIIPNKDSTVSVNVKGTLYGFLFDEKKLTKKIAESNIENYISEEIYIPSIKDFRFSLVDKENISFADVKNISFNLSGTSKVIWVVDKAKFISGILGKKKKDFNQILLQYPSIGSAELVLRPFWKASFPEKSKSIEVIVNYPK